MATIVTTKSEFTVKECAEEIELGCKLSNIICITEVYNQYEFHTNRFIAKHEKKIFFNADYIIEFYD